MAINWKTFIGEWCIKDKDDKSYSINLYSIKLPYIMDTNDIIYKYLKYYMKKYPQYLWRALVDIHRGGEEKKIIFRNMLNRLFINVDKYNVGLILVAHFTPEPHLNIKSQQMLEEYYMRRNFEPIYGTCYKVYIRKPLKLRNEL